MKVTAAVEVRVVKAVVVEDAAHFFFDGTAYTKGTGKGNFAGKPKSGAMHGTVKIVSLNTGRYSLRSVGRSGNGRLVHINAGATLVVDGVQSTVAAFFAKHYN